MQASKPAGFVVELDFLRFAAAFCVAYSHTIGCFFRPDYAGASLDWPRLLLWQLFRALDGSTAVIIFFVISGFVLARAIDRNGEPLSLAGQARFVWQRCWRILPAHWLVLAATVGYIALAISPDTPWPLRPDQTTLAGFDRLPDSLTWDEVLANAALLHTRLNAVTWTLAVEMGAALLFPVLHDVARRNSVAVHLTIILSFTAASAFLEQDLLAAIWFCRYIPAFYAGILVETYGRDCVAWLRARRLPAAALWLLSWGLTFLPRGIWPNDYFLATHLAVPGAFLLVSATVWANDGAIGRCIRLAPLRLAGKWSYSFYLWHYPILRLTYRLCCSQLSVAFIAEHFIPVTLAAVLFTIAAALAMAMLTYRWVELPFIRLGGRLMSGLRSGLVPLRAAE